MDDDDVVRCVREVAVALLPELPAIGSGTAEYISGRLPEFARPDTSDIALAACQANSAALLDALVRGVSTDAMSPSEEVIRTTRDLVRAQIALDTLLSGYQVGITFWCRRWTAAVRVHCRDAPVAVALGVVDFGTTFLLSWLQMMTDRLGVDYRDEAERVSREWSMARTDEVRRVLRAEDVDVEAAGRRLDYDLTRDHVGLVVVRDGSDGATLEATAHDIASTISKVRPSVFRVDSDTVWVWIPTASENRAELSRAGVVAGCGRPGHGLDGFRRSHVEALEAVRVARLTDHRSLTVTHFADVELASLCSRDVVDLTRFVRSVLGELAASTAQAQRIRETLSSFYAANCNFRAAASDLGLHHNTVRYRLGKAEELLDRDPLERRLETELALHLGMRLGLVAGRGDD